MIYKPKNIGHRTGQVEKISNSQIAPQLLKEASETRTIEPQGSKVSSNRVLGPKYYTIYGISGLKPYYLGPWTLRGSASGRSSSGLGFRV